MGTDKALLPASNGVLLQQVAKAVGQATGSATVVAPPGRYEAVGLPLLLDRWPGEGPLGGILTALAASKADWNLMVAVDMPQLEPALLAALVDAAFDCGSLALVPTYPNGDSEPLCAMYHREAISVMQQHFDAGGRRVKDALALLPAAAWPLETGDRFVNVNTPEQWEAVSR